MQPLDVLSETKTCKQIYLSYIGKSPCIQGIFLVGEKRESEYYKILFQMTINLPF